MTTVLVTGEPGVGKTSLLVNLSRQLPVAGVISCPRMDERGKRTGIMARFPDTGEELELAVVARVPENRRMARLVASPPQEPALDVSTGVMVGPWRFSPTAIAGVNARLLEIATAPARRSPSQHCPPGEPPPADEPVVLIDEIGPLELLRHGGFLPGLEAVVRSALPTIVVVRPALVAELRRTIGSFTDTRSPGRLHTVTMADPKQIEPTARRILAMLQTL